MKILTKGATVHIVCDKHFGKNIIQSFVYFIILNNFSTRNILSKNSETGILEVFVSSRALELENNFAKGAEVHILLSLKKIKQIAKAKKRGKGRKRKERKGEKGKEEREGKKEEREGEKEGREEEKEGRKEREKDGRKRKSRD